jgi:hypothetical protein
MIADKNYFSPSHSIPKKEMKIKYYVISNINGILLHTVRNLKTKASIRSNIKFWSKADYPVDATIYEIGTDKKIVDIRNKYADGGHMVKWYE